ncbi:hypothetical protein [Kitasatospora viridis]|uniref:Uncharacterized protein n=1 Tax=Kitasatospora viridis TaxID=281105 RepID=A0A561TVA8_9ACTN|nr:hypothetical protein [Kitasatospora viridis]TWF91031.1 hypothetical protein FHX73_12143 [Kitasatospora viridis]
MELGATIRMLRAGVFTALLLVLSAGGHVLLTGAPLPPTVMAAAGLATFAVTLRLAAVERGFARIAIVLGTLELALNTLYNVGQDTCAGPVRSGGLLPDLLCGGAPAPTVGGGALHQVIAAPFQQILTTQLHLTTSQLALVLLAHLAAALLGALWLRRGEHAAFQLLAALALTAMRPVRLLLTWLLAPAAPAPGPRLPHRPTPDRRRPQDVLLRAVARRGPPLVVAAR